MTVAVRVSSSSVERARLWLRGTPSGLAALALGVGAGAGAGAVAFRYLILGFTRLFSGTDDYSGAGRVANPGFPWLGVGFVVLAPVVGGLIYGPLVTRFAPEARGHGVPEVMLAVAERGGRIRPQVSVVKALASALCIGSGGSVGREGPIVQIGSALGSSLGQLARLPEGRLRILVACGAAGGISATFNAPIAGVFFALELILQDFAAESFGVVVLASVAAGVVGRSAFGSQPFLTLPAFHLVAGWEYGLYALLGALAGVAGIAFIRVLYGSEDLADRLWRGPEWLRPAAGGVLLGLVLLALPQLYGVGYPVLESAVRGNLVLGLIALLLIGKIVATSVTIAIGGSGGVFAPSLFMGAMLGALFGGLAHDAFGGSVAPAGAYALVGMGAVFAGAARAPITAVIIIFELTGDYTIILPLMVAVVVATSISTLLSRDTIYTLKLRRRGIDIQRGRSATLMQVIPLSEAMQPCPRPVAMSADLAELTSRLLDEGREALPVVDASGQYQGVVTSREVEDAMSSNALDATAESLMIEVAPVASGSMLRDALSSLVQRSRGGIPVVEDGRLVGWLTHLDALSAYHRRLQGSVDVAAHASPPVGGRPSPEVRLGDFRIVELTIGAGEPAGRRVSEVRWPESSLLLAVQHDGNVVVPRGGTLLAAGDRLTMLVPAAAALSLADLVAEPVAPAPG